MTKTATLTATAPPAAVSTGEAPPMDRAAPAAAPNVYLREVSAYQIITSDLRIAHLLLSDGRAATALERRGPDGAVEIVEIFADQPPASRARKASWAPKDERIGDADMASLRPVLAHLLSAREVTPADLPPVEERVLAWTDWISRGVTRIEAIIALQGGADRQMTAKVILGGRRGTSSSTSSCDPSSIPPTAWLSTSRSSTAPSASVRLGTIPLRSTSCSIPQARGAVKPMREKLLMTRPRTPGP